MKITVVECNCFNSEPHYKLQGEDGRTSVPGFFSIVRGKKVHEALLASGYVQQTEEEKLATEQEINSCDLPAECAEDQAEVVFAPEDKAQKINDEERFIQTATDLLKIHPAEEHEGMVKAVISTGLLTEEQGEKVLALVKETTPAENTPEVLTSDEEIGELSDEFLQVAADELRMIFPLTEHKGMVASAVLLGIFTEEEGEKILALAKEATKKASLAPVPIVKREATSPELN